MLVVTSRPLVRTRLRSLAEDLALPIPTFVERAEQVLGAAPSPLLLLDLGSCADAERLEPIVREWEAQSPGAVLVVFAPLVDRDAELRTTVMLARTAASSE